MNTPNESAPAACKEGLADVAMEMAQQPVAGRPESIVTELCIYDLDVERGRQPMPFADIIRTARSRALPVNLKDDIGQELIGTTDRTKVRVDGPKVFAEVTFRLLPTHRVHKLFGIPDVSAEEMADATHKRELVAAVSADEIMAINIRVGEGASDAVIMAEAYTRGTDPEAVKLLLGAIRAMRAIDPSAVETVAEAIAPAEPASIGGAVGGSVLDGAPRVDARISGTVESAGGVG